MKFTFACLIATIGLSVAAPAESGPDARSGTVQGFDISAYQTNVNFGAAYQSGARFVIIKATEGLTYKSPEFNTQYTGATRAHFIRGGYHFARPDVSSGSQQAEYFAKNGGGWSGDGITLPGMLDLEGYPNKPECYGLSQSAMVAWIRNFADTYHQLTSRYPMIYTGYYWWQDCTGNSNDFHSTSPLVLANYNSKPTPVPGDWPFYTIWQYNDHYQYGGDSDVFNGDITQLKKLATG
ncbi:Glycoside hydrolase superfamily [Elaphomyces granulatus]|jgi:GH25 family lysozyme M1 (1,4-beta-N-acetylmuramidase)